MRPARRSIFNCRPIVSSNWERRSPYRLPPAAAQAHRAERRYALQMRSPVKCVVRGLAALALICTINLSFASSDLALIDAASKGDVPSVLRLLDVGASVKARDAIGRTALVAATDENRIEVVRVLIAAGGDVNAQDDVKNSAFLLAGARGYLSILRLTIAAGADLTSTNRFGGAALIPACHYGHVETVRYLLTTRIDIDHVNNLGWTALLEAIILGNGGPAHTEIVRLLVAAGAKVNLGDRQGVTPLAHAKIAGFRDIQAILSKAGGR